MKSKRMKKNIGMKSIRLEKRAQMKKSMWMIKVCEW